MVLLAACDKAGVTSDSDTGGAKIPATTVRGSATLSWTPPTKNTDGSRLTDLAGYKIHYGTSEKYFQRVIEIKDSSATEYTISDLPPFTYYSLCHCLHRHRGRERALQYTDQEHTMTPVVWTLTHPSTNL